MRPVRIALYGDVNLNLIDGSAIWLASVVQVLHRIERTQLTVLRKAPERRDVVTAEIAALPRVTLVEPPSRSALTPEAALDELERLDARQPFDIILLRGYALCRLAVGRSRLADRLWVYLTDIPQDAAALTEQDREQIGRIAAVCDRLLCQTEHLRSHLEGITPHAAYKTILLPPMVPPEFVRPAAATADPTSDASPGTSDGGRIQHPGLSASAGVYDGGRTQPRREVRRLFYAGKFAPQWGFLELVDAFSRLRATHSQLELHVAGDKIHSPPDDPAYKAAVEAALTGTDGLVWHGGVTRAQVAGLLAEADIALSARHRDLDDSLELSTKVLEYGAAGVPVVLNRVAMHIELFGDGYPLFVDALDEVADVIAQAIDDPERWQRARDTAHGVAAAFTYDRVAERLRPHLDRQVPANAVDPGNAASTADAANAASTANGSPPRVLVASHDVKFFEAISDHLRRCGADVRYDLWTGHAKHDEAASKQLLDWAQVVICEWAVGNAVWYSRNLHAGQRLIVRLHRMELDTEFPAEIAVDRVDRVVVVSDLFRDKAVDQLGWPADRIDVIPNWVDTLTLDRPKLPEARFHLGLLGWIPYRKRLDRALDVVERLAAGDDRWRLYLGGKLPWELRWVWMRLDERQFFTSQLDRVRTSPLLRRAVSFDGDQHNVASWLRKVGVLLSPSDDESFHLAVAEGMASGAVPVIWPWGSARQVYGQRWLCEDAASAAERIACTDWESERRAAQQFVRRHYPLEPVVRAWAELVFDHAG